MPDTEQTFESGRVQPLYTLPCGMRVKAGELNLFLLRREADGSTGGRIFVESLTAGDVFYPEEVFEHNGQEYFVGLVPVGDLSCEPTDDSDRPQWEKTLRLAIRHIIHKQVQPAPVPDMLRIVIEAELNRKERLHNHDVVNRCQTDIELSRKLDNLGSMAGVSLKQTKEEQEEAKENAAASDPLMPALQAIAKLYHLPEPTTESLLENRDLPQDERVSRFCEQAGWRNRPVELTGDFYKHSARPLLAYRAEDGMPLILYLDSKGSEWSAPALGKKRYPLTRAVAEGIEPRGRCFYERFPENKEKRCKLWGFVFRNTRSMLFLVFFVGLLSSLLGLAMPMATQYITGEIIPMGNMPELYQIGALLLILTLCQITFGVAPTLIMTFFSTKQYERFQAAMYDHILRIPVNTFHICDSGDFTQRVLAASSIQQALFNVISQQLINILMCVVSLGLMFWYSTKLATWGLIVMLIYAVVHFLLARRNLKPLRKHAEADGKMNGMLRQFFDGIIKIRSAGAEQRVLSRLTDDFGESVQQNYITDRNSAIQELVVSVFPMVISIGFYAMAGGYTGNTLEIPVFLAFMAAFQNFQDSTLGVAGAIWSLQAMRPQVDRFRPILEAEPEDNNHRHPCSTLTGKVEARHLSFRYSADGPLILDNVSFTAKPGEFIAIVGPSGAGKSSLVRLLLGFEQPEKGGIYYSDQDLAQLDLRSLRRQMGVILQNGRVMPGSILDNIITGTDYTMEDAIRALHLASFAEEVGKMPMSIYTMVGPDTISGGQQQRILIARALVGNPPIVVMDESTSALDNIAQDNVRRNMEQLQMTRIVIAHRLSTIMHADRIYVLEKGRIVQVGTYDELAAQPGTFRKLIQRQLN